MGMASIKDASQVHIAGESDGRLSAAFRDTLRKWGILSAD